jgi:hypothetical protein
MQRRKALAVGFYAGALLIGGVLGVAVDRLVVREWLDTRASDVRASRDRLATELGLSDDQRASLDSIYDAARRADSLLMAPVRPQRDSLWDAARSQLRAMLTPAQQATYDQMMQSRDRTSGTRR